LLLAWTRHRVGPVEGSDVQARRDAVELVAVHHWKLLTFFFFFLELFSLFFLHMKIWNGDWIVILLELFFVLWLVRSLSNLKEFI
jgi:hypothetical protein